MKPIFMVFIIFNYVISFAQAPENTRLIQQNTLKGSRLSLVETTDNYTYHIGIINSSEVGFDNLSATNVGLDDLFILKSNASTGSNSWFKTFNAGNQGVISPKYVYVDSSENIYVFAQFKGTVTVGTKTISSTNSGDAFLMKISNNGSAVWIDYLANGYDSLYKTKCVTDGTDTFFVYGGSHLLRLNDSTGDVIYDNAYNNVELKSVAIKDQNLYVAGATTSDFAVLGGETINQSYVGFVVKGSKNADFSASLRTTPTETGIVFSDISDVAISSDGYLLLSGFNTNKAINLITETGTVTYSYNPNTAYTSTRLYNYVAKVDSNLGAVSFFRSSSPVTFEGTYNIRSYAYSIKLIPYGNIGNFRQLIYIGVGSARTLSTFINTNGSNTSIPFNTTTFNEYTLNTSNDNNGNVLQSNQPINYDFKMSASGNYYTQVNNNVRIFTTNLLNSQSSNSLWIKQKATSVGGSISGAFMKYLNSEKSDLFVTALVEGTANFFGTQVNNDVGSYSRYIKRLGADGLPKWTTKFDYSNSISNNYYNVSQNYVTVDKDDNFYIIINRLNTSSSNFTDATGTTVNFSQNFGSDKVLLKLDKNGKYIWSKQISGSQLSPFALTIDSDNNVYVIGTSFGLVVDGNNIGTSGNTSLVILKFASNGSLAYSKTYPNDMHPFSMLPVLDSQNNLYVFSEPSSLNNYVFGNVTIPANSFGTDFIMVKFDTSGNAVFGKNFYANSTSLDYAWPNDVKFDGDNFIVMGNYLNYSAVDNYIGLDLVNIPKTYLSATQNYVPFFAKIKKDGSVVWQKALDSNNYNTGNYTNINLDENKNIYMYYYVKDKVSINGTEYAFDATKGSKIFIKLDTNGALKYYKTVDFSSNLYPIVDVIAEDKINAMAFTSENNLLNYPVKNANASNLYIATFGNLDQKYLTPMSNYLLLTNTSISNNTGNANTFTFDLVNNVNWTAESDQSWLTLDFVKLTQKTSSQALISGTGDAKVTLNAETNNSGTERSASVLINGDGGVASKTVVVTQTGILANQEAKTFVTVIYPNPTSDILNVQTEQKISKIEIFDISGKLLKSNSGNNNSIKVSDLTKGLYLIKIYSDNHIINSKFIKN